jgi:xanthine dehydrogenase accessory factor
MTHWIDTLVRLRDCGQPAVVVTVASTRGSAPREAGTKMIVTAAAVHGTIGGGHLEHKAIAIARDLLISRGPNALRRFPLGASLGQCCGGLVNLLFEPVVDGAPWLDALVELRRDGVDGVMVSTTHGIAAAGKLVVASNRAFGSVGDGVEEEVTALSRQMLIGGDGPRLLPLSDGEAALTLLLEPVRANEFAIVLFGAGHVGRALVRILADLPCRITWVDEREDEFPRDVPENVRVVCTDTPESEVDAAKPATHFLVMTHSHALDEALAERILRRNDCAWFGLIGSLTKRRMFERRMERRGMPAARFAAMSCPIGAPGIPGKEPAVIAVAVAAELLQVRARAVARVDAPANARRA